MKQKIPKIIWLLWFQGQKEAPPLAIKCFKSWTDLNPDYLVIFLDNTNLPKYLTKEVISICTNPSISLQAKSDIVRINLLAEHGGIWADSSCMCLKPLDVWLPIVSKTGFFCFSHKNHHHTLASWFMISSKNHLITKRLSVYFNNYWSKNPQLQAYQSSQPLLKLFLLQLINQVLKIKKTWWFTKIMTKWFRVYPYFIFHYAFEYLLKHDKSFKAEWEKVLFISAKSMSIKHLKKEDNPYVIKYSHH